MILRTITKSQKENDELIGASQPISVVITTFNEQDHIEGVIESAIWADEILIVDSFSSDNTTELASKYPCKIIKRNYISPADQKNWAIGQAKNDWVLILDADERVTPELKIEIELLLQTNIDCDAFWIYRKNYFMNREIRYSGWQNDKVIRLIRRNSCRYNEVFVHEEIQTDKIKVSKLHHKLNHYTYKNLDHFIDKMQRYAAGAALDYSAKTTKITSYHLFLKPVFRFFKHYIIKGGIRDGLTGFIISVIMAWGVFLRYLKLKEIRKDYEF